jgi:formylglycine-generating enzyme required for sulfatase activity
MVTANNQWRPQFQTFDGVEMAQVPPGCFMMGSDIGISDEKPVTKICFGKPFWIDKTEVTQEQFERFGGQTANQPYYKGNNRPVEQITWFEARDFCTKRKVRLPTEAEWEYAARGPSNLAYPWGNVFDGGKVVYNRTSSQGTTNVGSIPAGASWVGAVDMSGNVEEWHSTIYMPYPYDAGDGRESNYHTNKMQGLRGGSWNDVVLREVRAARRDWDSPSNVYFNLGFRCARS